MAALTHRAALVSVGASTRSPVSNTWISLGNPRAGSHPPLAHQLFLKQLAGGAPVVHVTGHLSGHHGPNLEGPQRLSPV